MTGKPDRAEGQIVVDVDGTAASAGAVWWAVREAQLRRARVLGLDSSGRGSPAKGEGAVGELSHNLA